MPLHQGQIVEKIVRKNGYSISAIARIINVNRRTVYNWFNLPILKTSVIYQIAQAIKHDFSVEFPELFKPEDFVFKNKSSLSAEHQAQIVEAEIELIWKERYLDLLERYTKLSEERYGELLLR
jgi:lambda repressor-like predicted transcriptional regulator